MDRLIKDELLKIPRVTPQVYEELSSTSSFLKDLAKEGAREGTLILARGQSAGRGRRGRHFHSPRDRGLYMSLLLRPKKEVSLELLTAATAVAATRAVKNILGLELCIKWVNDLNYKGKKVGGILTEGSFLGQSIPDYLIVGLGLNVYEPLGGFPEDLSSAASLLSEKKEGLLNLLLEEILTQWWPLYDDLDKREFLQEYRQRNIVLGKKILVLSETPWSGEAIKIDEACNLIVRDASGSLHRLNSGEISIKVADD